MSGSGGISAQRALPMRDIPGGTAPVWLPKEGRYTPAMRVEVRSTVGAGDSMVAVCSGHSPWGWRTGSAAARHGRRRLQRDNGGHTADPSEDTDISKRRNCKG